MVKIAFLLILLVITSSCNKLRNQASKVNANSAELAAVANIYPHSLDFKKTSTHGAEYRKNQESCKLCHGSDFTGGNSKVSCKNCHNFPHSWAFTQGDHLGGSDFASARQNCGMCHKGFLTNMPSFVEGCYDCHSEEELPR